MYTQPRYLSLQRPRLFANSWLQSNRNFQPGLNFPHNDIILGDIHLDRSAVPYHSTNLPIFWKNPNSNLIISNRNLINFLPNIAITASIIYSIISWSSNQPLFSFHTFLDQMAQLLIAWFPRTKERTFIPCSSW